MPTRPAPTPGSEDIQEPAPEAGRDPVTPCCLWDKFYREGKDSVKLDRVPRLSETLDALHVNELKRGGGETSTERRGLWQAWTRQMLIALLRLDHDRRPLDRYLAVTQYNIAGDILMLWIRAKAQGMTNAVRLKPTQLFRRCVDPDVPTDLLPPSVSHTRTVYLFGDSTTILRSMTKTNKTCGTVTDEWRKHFKDTNPARIVDLTEGSAMLGSILTTMQRWRATKATELETDDHPCDVSRRAHSRCVVGQRVPRGDANQETPGAG